MPKKVNLKWRQETLRAKAGLSSRMAIPKKIAQKTRQKLKRQANGAEVRFAPDNALQGQLLELSVERAKRQRHHLVKQLQQAAKKAKTFLVRRMLRKSSTASGEGAGPDAGEDAAKGGKSASAAGPQDDEKLRALRAVSPAAVVRRALLPLGLADEIALLDKEAAVAAVSEGGTELCRQMESRLLGTPAVQQQLDRLREHEEQLELQQQKAQQQKAQPKVPPKQERQQAAAGQRADTWGEGSEEEDGEERGDDGEAEEERDGDGDGDGGGAGEDGSQEGGDEDGGGDGEPPAKKRQRGLRKRKGTAADATATAESGSSKKGRRGTGAARDGSSQFVDSLMGGGGSSDDDGFGEGDDGGDLSDGSTDWRASGGVMATSRDGGMRTGKSRAPSGKAKNVISRSGNRMGQRQRQRLLEQKQGHADGGKGGGKGGGKAGGKGGGKAGAKGGGGRAIGSAGRGGGGRGGGGGWEGRTHVPAAAASWSAGGGGGGGSGSAAAKVEKLHPSWEAKKTPEGAIQAFAGKRMVF